MIMTFQIDITDLILYIMDVPDFWDKFNLSQILIYHHTIWVILR
jgi:hypothetical protein